MFLEEFKRKWSAVANAVQRELLLEELVIRLALEPTQPADFFDRPQLVELMEAARFAFPLQLQEVR